MPSLPRVYAYLSVILSFSVSLFAQSPKLSPAITAAATGDKVRFSSPGDIAQIRVQIVSISGETLFDSSWKDGNVLDWPVERALADGAYRCTVMVKDLAGQVAEKENALVVRSGQLAIEPGAENDDPKITLLVHDEKDGAIVNTSGDLSFRLGKFFAGKDAEKMRLTSDGDLRVQGMIHADKGIAFSDGTILKTSDGEVVIERPASAKANGGRIVETVVRSQPSAIPRRLVPAPTVSPDYQFKVDNIGVHIGTTNTFGLDVAGNVTLSSNLALPMTAAGGTAGVITLNGNRFAHSYGPGNTFLGTNAGNFTMTSTSNTVIGASTFINNTTGDGNTAIGVSALYSNTTGSENTVSGHSALFTNVSGSGNTAIGSAALFRNTTGSEDTASGDNALENNTTGNFNTGVGVDALDGNTTGSNNIGIGTFGGQNLTTGNYNIDIGNPGFAAEANTIRIGTSGTHTRAFISGIRDVTTGAQNAINVMIDANGQLGTVSSSRRFKFDIADMNKATDRLMRLRPVTFRYLQYGDDAATQYGLIAEEVAEVYPEMVARGKDGQIDTVIYQFLAPMLLNEVQKQHREIEQQRKTIAMLERRLQALEARNN